MLGCFHVAEGHGSALSSGTESTRITRDAREAHVKAETFALNDSAYVHNARRQYAY